MRDYQLAGGPDWLESERFDIEGKADSAANESELRRMLQTFLAERLGLAMHRERKDMQVYMMTVAKGGLKAPEQKPENDMQPGVFQSQPADPHTKHMIIMNDLDQFAELISLNPITGIPVVNKTGLGGRYRFFLGWDEDDDFLPALQREFGLKLEKQKAPVDLLVIDRVQRPDAN